MVKLIKRKIGGYGTAIPLVDNAPLTLSLICSSNGFVCSKSSSVPSSSSLDVVSSDPLLSPSLDVVSCCESLYSLLLSSSADPDELEDSSLLSSLLLLLSSLDDESSSLSDVLGAGVIGTLSLPSSPSFDIVSCCESLSLSLPSSADSYMVCTYASLIISEYCKTSF